MLACLLTKHPLEGGASDNNKHGNMEQAVIMCLFKHPCCKWLWSNLLPCKVRIPSSYPMVLLLELLATLPPPWFLLVLLHFVFFVLISKLLEDVHKYELKALSSVNFSCSFGFNYLFDALKLGWNVRIFSWDWLTIDLARVSMGPRYPGSIAWSLLRRLGMILDSVKKKRLYVNLQTVCSPYREHLLLLSAWLSDLNFSLDRVF